MVKVKTVFHNIEHTRSGIWLQCGERHDIKITKHGPEVTFEVFLRPTKSRPYDQEVGSATISLS